MKSTLLLIGLVATLTACGRKEDAQPVRASQPAQTRIVSAPADDNSRQYSGEIRARHEITLGFRTGGVIVERTAQLGAIVKAGQVLARLDRADASLQAGAANAQYLLAENEIKRYRELRGKGFVSQSALDAKEAALQVAGAQAGLTHNQSDYTVLRAPHDGMIVATLADVGQVVAAGQSVLHLAQTDEMEVAIDIPESQFSSRHVGDVAEVIFLSGAPLSGRLRELSASADAASRTYSARVSFSATQAVLGMTARVRFKDKLPAELLIPVAAIYQDGSRMAVWIVGADRRISLRHVQIGAYRDNGAVIVSGLAGGERIVSAGVHRLTAGQQIQLIEGAQ